MATISSMASDTYKLYQYAQNNGASLFSSNAASKSSSAWGGSSSGMDSSAVLSGLTGISASTREMVSSYDAASKAFYADFDSTMKDLKSSAQAVGKLDFSQIAKGGLTVTENEDGTTTTTKSDAMKDAIKSVKQLVSDYNDSIDLFSDNADVSKRISRMQTSFSDTTYRSGSYSSIGISVDAKTGKMSVDEDKLAKAIADSPEKVSGILGKNGLSGKAMDHASFATGQRDKLFPSASSMFGSQMSSAAIYSGNSLQSISKYASAGSLLNMFG